MKLVTLVWNYLCELVSNRSSVASFHKIAYMRTIAYKYLRTYITVIHLLLSAIKNVSFLSIFTGDVYVLKTSC
jgi:hypothetical protein